MYGHVPVLTEVSSPDPGHISLASGSRLVEITCGTCGLIHYCMWLGGGRGGEKGRDGGMGEREVGEVCEYRERGMREREREGRERRDAVYL